MLKGHVFKQQVFGNQIFALFINTFLAEKNGISNNYKNSMEVSYSGNTLTIDSGAVCIQGRFLEEDTYTTISAGNDASFCKLVIEIDLDKQNTDTDFTQGYYKIVKSTSGYPTLTQTDIVKNNSGVYQYELARFKTSSNGITDFTDMRTYLDFDSIYGEIQKEYKSILYQLQQEFSNVESGSAYMLKNNIAVLRGKVTLNANTSENVEKNKMMQTIFKIDFPIGFNPDNCFVLSFGGRFDKNKGFCYGDLSGSGSSSVGYVNGAIPKSVTLGYSEDGTKSVISCQAWNIGTSSKIFEYKIVLMKYLVEDSEYTLGDVNGDGVINENDIEMLDNYLLQKIALTEQQFKAGDVNKDGIIDTVDTLKIVKYLNGDIESL